MLKIYQTPIFRKKYIDSDGSTKEFVYRTVATLNNISVVFESVQIPVNKIGNNGTGDIFIQVIYNDGKTQFYLKNIDNNAAAFFGDKYFENSQAQIVYKYLNNIQYDIYDATLVGDERVGKLLLTTNQPQQANGLSVLNVSEIVNRFTSLLLKKTISGTLPRLQVLP